MVRKVMNFHLFDQVFYNKILKKLCYCEPLKIGNYGGKNNKKIKSKLMGEEGGEVDELKSKKRKLDVDSKQKKVIVDNGDDFVDDASIPKANVKLIQEKK